MRPVKFYILTRDYSGVLEKKENGPFKIDQSTAVIAYKKWFFNCLRQFGKIIPIGEKAEREEELRRLLARPDAIFVAVNCPLEKKFISRVPHRLLWLSLGSLLLPRQLYKFRYLPSAQVNLVSTGFQIDRIKSYFGDFSSKMSVFSNKIDRDFFTIPDSSQRRQARKRQGIREGQLHIIYAGRLIVTKGICQMIRALDIWPAPPNIKLTLAGNVEEGFGIAFSSAQHKTFSRFFNEEILCNKHRPWLRLEQAKNKQELRDLFWSADLFVNPSIQPDEDFGVTPRQAMACGLPVLTTNFCGLRPLAQYMPWKGIDTYPTLSGSRFSLKQFRSLLQKAFLERDQVAGRGCRDFIIRECDPEMLKDNLRKAIKYLIERPAEVACDTDNIERNIKKQLLGSVDARAFKYFTDTRKELNSAAFVYGDGPSDYDFPIVQGVYSAMEAPPKVEKSSIWRGFFRVAFWDREKALIEFGYPGLRIRRYPKKSWGSLVKSARYPKQDECVIVPKDKGQAAIVQELVDLGYLVSDENDSL